MKRFLLLGTLFTGLLFTYSCADSWWNCIEGNGHTSVVRRVVGDFTNVANYGNFIVDVTPGITTSVSVEADENLLPYIETYIQGNTLVIETEDNHCIRSREQVYVHVITPEVYELKLAGSGAIYCDNFNTDELKLEISGSGEIRSENIVAGFIDAEITGSGEIILAGNAEQTSFYIAGSGNIKSINLEQNKCIATITGSGSMYVFVNDLLDVQISGSGNVVYKGDPSVRSDITGSGRIIRYK